MSIQINNCKTEDETRSLAKNFALNLVKGDVVELIGDVGSGKTLFTREIAEFLGATGQASSPSFVIKNEYSGKFKIIHIDLYRIDDIDSIQQELQENIEDRNSLVIIEWAKTLEDILPEKRHKVTFEVTGENERKITIE